MSALQQPNPASENITEKIAALADWRGQTLAWVRQRILEAVPEVEEEWKWVRATSPGTPVWSRSGIVCTGETYKQVVKLTFAYGASLPDPQQLFNRDCPLGAPSVLRRPLAARLGPF